MQVVDLRVKRPTFQGLAFLFSGCCFGVVEPVDFVSFEDIEERFEQDHHSAACPAPFHQGDAWLDHPDLGAPPSRPQCGQAGCGRAGADGLGHGFGEDPAGPRPDEGSPGSRAADQAGGGGRLTGVASRTVWSRSGRDGVEARPPQSPSCSAPSPKPPAPVPTLLVSSSTRLAKRSRCGPACMRDRVGLSLSRSRDTRGQGLPFAEPGASHCRTGRVGIRCASPGSGPAAKPVIRRRACRGCAACGRGGSAWRS